MNMMNRIRLFIMIWIEYNQYDNHNHNYNNHNYISDIFELRYAVKPNEKEEYQ